MTEAETVAQLADIARALLKHGNARDAMTLLASAAALGPDDGVVAALECEAAHRAGFDEIALAKIVALLPRVSSDRARSLRRLEATVLLALGRRAEAEAIYQADQPADMGQPTVSVVE